jgi:hypothetical protein
MVELRPGRRAGRNSPRAGPVKVCFFSAVSRQGQETLHTRHAICSPLCITVPRRDYPRPQVAVNRRREKLVYHGWARADTSLQLSSGTSAQIRAIRVWFGCLSRAGTARHPSAPERRQNRCWQQVSQEAVLIPTLNSQLLLAPSGPSICRQVDMGQAKSEVLSSGVKISGFDPQHDRTHGTNEPCQSV